MNALASHHPTLRVLGRAPLLGRGLVGRAKRAAFGRLTVPHGHNYTLDVTVRGPIDERTGMVIDLGELKRIVEETVVERFDHADLNADPLFRDRVPTTENIAHRRVGAAGAQARPRAPRAGARVGGPHAVRRLSRRGDERAGGAHARLSLQRRPSAGESRAVGRATTPPSTGSARARTVTTTTSRSPWPARPMRRRAWRSTSGARPRGHRAPCSTPSITRRWRTSPALAGVITTGEGLARAFWRDAGPRAAAGRSSAWSCTRPRRTSSSTGAEAA